jgi:hypothetical protein
MSILKSFIILGSFLSLPVLSQDIAMITFEQFNASLVKYGDKVEHCSTLAKGNSINSKEVDLLKKLPIKTLQDSLPYLEEISMNKCLQPEKGLLAEKILNLQSLHLDKDNSVYAVILKTISETKKMEFNISRHNITINFLNLEESQQVELIELESFKKPFNIVKTIKELHPELFN